MQSHLGRALSHELSKHDMTQAEMAKRAGIRQSTIARMIANHRRPDEATLRAICTKFGNHHAEIRLLIEHLRDEITRAGKLDRDITIAASGYDRTHIADLNKTLDILRQEALQDGTTRAMLRDLAHIITRHYQVSAKMLAAEDRAEYKTKKERGTT